MQNPKEQSGNFQVQQIKPKDYLIKYAASQEEAKLISSLYVSNPVGLGRKEDLKAVIDVCAKWRWMAGISVHNQDENEIAKELLLVAKFITGNYPDLTIEEINLAIELSLTDKLNIDVRAFNVFSPMYVSRILNAYIDYKRKSVHEVLSRKYKDDDIKKEKEEVSPEYKMQSMVELIRYFHEQYKSKGQVMDYFNTLYNFFRRIELLKPDKQTIDEAMEYGNRMAKQEKTNDLREVLSGKKSNHESLVKGYARNYCVQKLFDSLNLETIVAKVELKHFK